MLEKEEERRVRMNTSKNTSESEQGHKRKNNADDKMRLCHSFFHFTFRVFSSHSAVCLLLGFFFLKVC